MSWYFLGIVIIGMAVTASGIHGLRHGGRSHRGRRLLEGIEFIWAIVAVILLHALLGWNPVALASGSLLLHFLISAGLSTLVETRHRQGIDAQYPGWFSLLECISGPLMILGAGTYLLIT